MENIKESIRVEENSTPRLKEDENDTDEIYPSLKHHKIDKAEKTSESFLVPKDKSLLIDFKKKGKNNSKSKKFKDGSPTVTKSIEISKSVLR